MSQIPEPVYQINKISSEAETTNWQGLKPISTLLSNGFVVLWQHHAVFTGEIKGGVIHWLNNESPVPDDEHLVRLRAFNQKQEYHFWRSSEGIKGRLRTDDDTGNGAEVINTQMVIRGVIAKPLKKVSTEFAEAKTLAVLTRNYIDYDPKTQQAGYVDSRFVNFESFNG
jgi:hypothetical protein